MASDMLEKLSIKENYKNIKWCFQILRKMDSMYCVLSGVMQLLSVLIPYIT